MITIKITIDGTEICGYSNATEFSPEKERKYAAVLMAAIDGATAAMSNGQSRDAMKDLIRATIDQRMAEAKLDPSAE